MHSERSKMDKFVTRKRKPESDSNEDSNSSDKRPVPQVSTESTAETATLSAAENRVDQASTSTQKVNRKFNVEWENLFFATEQKGKTVCLICRVEFNENRKFTVKRHFDNTHSEYDTKFPLSSDKRAAEITRLKTRLGSEQKVVRQFLGSNEIIARASYEIAFEMAKHAKSYSDGEFYKRLLSSTVETLCENSDEKFKTPLLDKIKKLPLSHQTVGRRVNEIAGDIEANLKRDLERCDAFSLALDESTDISSVAQLIFWVRYIVDGRIKEDILALVPLTERTQAVDIFRAFKTVEDRFNLDLNKLVSVCTDGAPPMIGVHGGFVALLKNYVTEKTENHKLISYHCIIHQENLCAEVVAKDCSVLTTVTKVSE